MNTSLIPGGIYLSRAKCDLGGGCQIGKASGEHGNRATTAGCRCRAVDQVGPHAWASVKRRSMCQKGISD
jgi:hypothetical protein